MRFRKESKLVKETFFYKTYYNNYKYITAEI